MRLDARTAPIHEALKDHLEPKNLAYALRLWSEEFIEQPNLSLKMFVERFYTRQPMSMRSHELYNHLLPAMMDAFKARLKFEGELIDPYDFPDYDLDEAPSSAPVIEEVHEPVPETKTYRPKIVPVKTAENEALVKKVSDVQVDISATPARIERYEVFSFFMRTLCKKIPTERREKLFDRYAEEIRASCIYPVGGSFYEWLVEDSDYFEDEGLDIEAMSNITHTLYMGMCDYLGPVEADNVLNYAVSKTDSEFSDAEFDISKLL